LKLSEMLTYGLAEDDHLIIITKRIIIN